MHTRIYLEKRDPAHNQFRFYSIRVSRGVFGDWAVVREWGRIGSPGTIRSDWYASSENAVQAAEGIERQKCKRGYGLKG